MEEFRSNHRNSNYKITKIKGVFCFYFFFVFEDFGGPRRTQLSGGRLHCWLVNASKLTASADRREMPVTAT